MADQEVTFLQLPPDSTGKKAGSAGRLVIDYQGESTSLPFEVGQTVIGQSSSAQGEIVGFNKVDFTVGEGQLYLGLSTVDGTFSAGENLLVTGALYGSIKSSSPLNNLYYQKFTLVDKNNPHRSTFINDQNALRITYADGSPSVSSFGDIHTANTESIRTYTHAYNSLEDEFYATSGGGGSITYLPNERSVLLDTNDTASGSFYKRQSHYYHPYQPGNTLIGYFTLQCGDGGKTNVRRRWGLYDDKNGLFFQLNGTTFSIVLRTYVNGSVEETVINQSNFNGNKLDGTGETGFDLDISKANLYWIDIQWLGVGLVRFGVFNERGEKIVCHTLRNPNTNTGPYISYATLPLSYEIENIGTATSSSEMKFICSAIYNIGHIKRQFKSRSYVSDNRRTITSASGEVPICSIRAVSGINGLENHTIALLDNFSFDNLGDATVIVRLRKGSVLSGDSWHTTLNSNIEHDCLATGFAITGVEVFSSFVNANNTEHYSIAHDFNGVQDEVGTLVLGNGFQVPITVTAQVIDSGVSGQVMSSINWDEVIL